MDSDMLGRQLALRGSGLTRAAAELMDAPREVVKRASAGGGACGGEERGGGVERDVVKVVCEGGGREAGGDVAFGGGGSRGARPKKKSLFARQYGRERRGDGEEEGGVGSGPLSDVRERVGEEGWRGVGEVRVFESGFPEVLRCDLRAGGAREGGGGESEPSGVRGEGGELGELWKEVEEENDRKLSGMSGEEVERMRGEVEAELDRGVVELLRRRGAARGRRKKEAGAGSGDGSGYSRSYVEEVEEAKRRWMQPVSEEEAVGRPKSRMEAESYRFDFEGRLLYYPDVAGNVRLEPPSTPGDIGALLHHGEDPATPGYTLGELAYLARSTFPGQRSAALKGIKSVIEKAKRGYYDIPGTGKVKFVNALIMTHLVRDIGVALLLRSGIDDNNATSLRWAIEALWALLCSESDERVFELADVCPDAGYASWPLQPRNEHNRSRSEVAWEGTDHCKTEIDAVLALCETGVLARLRYIMEVIEPPEYLLSRILDLLIRFARHSRQVAEHFAICPRLLRVLAGLAGAPSRASSEGVAAKALKAIRVSCQGSREVARACRELGVLDELAKHLVDREESSSFQFLHGFGFSLSESAVCALEALKIWDVVLRYGIYVEGIMNLQQHLLELVSRVVGPSESKSPAEVRDCAVRAQIFSVFGAVVQLADFSGEPETSRPPVPWSRAAQTLQPALMQLKTYLSPSTSAGTAADWALLSSCLALVSTYFERLHAISSYSREEAQLRRLCYQTVGPFLTQSRVMASVLSALSSQESWKIPPPARDSDRSSFFDLCHVGPYQLSLTSHPTLSWKSQAPAARAHQQPRMAAHAALLLSSVRLIEAVGLHEKSFSTYLTASQISSPLITVLKHYFEFACSFSDSIPALYATRVLHRMAARTIKIMYHDSVTAQEAALVCFGSLLPGDEPLALHLLQRAIFHYLRSTPEAYHPSAQKTPFGPALQQFFSNLILDSQPPTPTHSLLIPLENHPLPLRKHWPLLPIRTCHLHLHSEKKSVEKSAEKNTNALQQFTRSTLELLNDSLLLLQYLNSVNPYFVSKLKPSSHFYSLFQCVLCASQLDSSDQLSRLALSQLERLLLKCPALLDLRIPIDLSIINPVVELWANEGPSAAPAAQLVSILLLTSSSLHSPSQISSSGQEAELKSLEQLLWPHVATLWHLLPPPLPCLAPRYFHPYLSLREHLLPHLISSLHSRHSVPKRNAWHFYYRFLLFQTSSYLWAPQTPLWTRQNALSLVLTPPPSRPPDSHVLTILHDLTCLDPSILSNDTLLDRDKALLDVHLHHFSRLPQHKLDALLGALNASTHPWDFSHSLLEALSRP